MAEIVFKLPETPDDRIKCFIANRVCSTDDDKAYIYRSYGRRKSGRKTRYYVHLSDNSYFSLTAENDIQAIEKANQRIRSIP